MVPEGKCDICGCALEALTDAAEQEAWKEHDGTFPGWGHGDSGRVCDDCYKKFMKWYEGNE